MSASVRPIPEGYHSITPQLTCRNASEAIEFYKKVFGAKVLMNMPGPNGKVMHAELQIGDSRLMVNDEFPGMAVAPEPSALHSSSLFTYTEDVDALFKRATDGYVRFSGALIHKSAVALVLLVCFGLAAGL